MTGMTMEQLNRASQLIADGLGLVVGNRLQIGFATHRDEGWYVTGVYETSVVLGDPIRIVAISVRRDDGALTSVPWEQIAYIDAVPPDGGVA